MKILFVLVISALLLCSCERYEMPELPHPVIETPETPKTPDEPVTPTEPELEKYDPTPSPDGTLVLYRYAVSDVPGLRVGVDTAEGKCLHTIDINTVASNDIMKLEWIGKGYFAVTTHVNPSTLEYYIYSAETGEETASYCGYAFTPLPMEEPTVIYAENVPHGFADKAYHSYAINGKTVYTSDEKGALLSEVAFSKDMKTVAFIEAIDNESETTALLAKGSFDGEKIELIEKIELPEYTRNPPRIDDDGTVSINEKRG